MFVVIIRDYQACTQQVLVLQAWETYSFNYSFY